MPTILLILGCIEFTIDPVDPDAPPDRVLVTESFRQEALPAVDLLFVVDDTASMAREQQSLATQFPALIDALSAEQVRWQAGVVTTDMGGDRAGWLTGDPWVVTESMPGAASAFEDNARVGTEGTGPEAGIAAAMRAVELSLLGGPNAGFRRADAALHVIFVSDSDDQSDDLLGSDPVEVMLDFLSDEADATGLPAYASAITGDVPDGCVSAFGSAAAGHRYWSVASDSGGGAVSICSGDFSPLLNYIGNQSINYRSRFWLQGAPVADSLRVSVDGDRLDEGWAYDGVDSSVVFEAESIPGAGAEIDVEYLVEVLP